MPNSTVIIEVTSLKPEDCFVYSSHTKTEFANHLHCHPDCELTFIENAKGIKRIVGDSIERIGDLDLALITGTHLEHAWISGRNKNENISEITIHFHDDLFINLLPREHFRTIREMFEKAKHGLLFSVETAEKFKSRLIDLGKEKNGFHSFVKLMQLMYDLSLEKQVRILSNKIDYDINEKSDSRRVKKVMTYLQENYKSSIRLKDVASLAGMSEVAFCRFIKKRTSKTFVEYLNNIRLGKAVRMLMDTTHSVNEICFECGFNNLSNFNRIFKKSKGCTPKQFRLTYLNSKT